jgi:GNAT superfamily N-acetyltransferase
VGEIKIREFDAADLPDVLEVLRRSLGETPLLKRTPELWRWKHVDNPFGRSLALVAEADGRIAGVRAMLRWDLTTPSGETFRCLRPVDTATDPDFGRRGIFRSLTEAAVSVATDQGIDLIFNTPNKVSGPGYLKMGWQEVGPIGVMVRPLLRRSGGAPEDVAPDAEAFFGDNADPAGGPVTDRPALGLRTPRTPEYMKWRFAGHPTARYQTISHEGQTAILRPNHRSGRKEVVVSELFGEAPAKVVRQAARASRAAYLAGWFSRGTPEWKAAVLGGMIPVPGVSALTLVANPLRSLPVDVLALSEWDISLGDLELL